jgi:hypothetical protein
LTKRTQTKKPTQQAPSTINSTPPKQAVEDVKVESNTVATPKPKRANSKAPAKPRGRPKKAVVEKPVPPEGRVGHEYQMPAPVSKAVDVASRNITYVSAGNAVPSKYEQFKAWLVFKLYQVTSLFRGY